MLEKRLENWGLVIRDPYSAPEMAVFSLIGNVYGDEKREPGKQVVTSYLVGKVGELVRTYSGSLYKLGEVSPEYEALFPNARERLFKSLPDYKVEE